MLKPIPIKDFIILELKTDEESVISLSAVVDATKLGRARYIATAIGPDVKSVKIGDVVLSAGVKKLEHGDLVVYFTNEEQVGLVLRDE